MLPPKMLSKMFFKDDVLGEDVLAGDVLEEVPAEDVLAPHPR